MLMMKQNTIDKNGQSLTHEKPLNYDESIALTINKERGFGANILYQNISFIVMCLGILSVNPI
jgi:hypothetical protein